MTQKSETDVSGTGQEARARGGFRARVPLVVVLAVAAIFLWQARDMPVGSLSRPGPGLWPVIVAGALVVAALIGFFSDVSAGQERFGRGSPRAFGGVAALALFILAFPWTGVILPGVLLLVFWLRVLAGESWRLSITVAVIVAFGCYFLFAGLLGVVFPDDLVASLWGGR